jgi:hypothetical protein
MQRLARSWTRWRQSRRQARLLRRQEEMRLLLTPLLYQALTPVAEAMARLDSRQQETRQRQQELLLMVEARHRETQELLLEILSSLQPTAQEQIVPLLGPPPLPTSSPSSAS